MQRSPSTSSAMAALPPEEVLRAVDSRLEGLSSQEAAARLARYGPNVVGVESRSMRAIVLEQVRNGINLLLAGAGVLTIVTGDLVDGAIILGLLLLNVGLSIIQEYRAERALAALRAMLPLRCRVRRDGGDVEVPSSQLVPGEIVYLRSGDLVPADVRLLEADDLEVNQASLTGESVPQTKSVAPVTSPLAAQWSDIAFAGTTVVGGQGLGVVVATGPNTQFGQTASLVQGMRTPSDFQTSLAHFGSFLLRFGVLLAAGVFISNALLGRGVLVSFTLALALALGIVPEALPAVTATTLALGAAQLARKKVLVRRLAAVEDMSVVDMLCTDKTGTITENRTTLTEVWSATAQDQVVEAALLCTSYPERGASVIDDAIIAFAAERRLDLDALGRLPRRTVMRFSPQTKRVIVVVHRPEGFELICKGAAATVIERCVALRTPDGDRELSSLRATVDTQLERLQDAGARVLAVAVRSLPSSDPGPAETADSGLTLLGLLACSDPPRPGAAATLARAEQLGVRVKIVTGDAVARGAALARQIQLDLPEGSIVSAEELRGPGAEGAAVRGRIFGDVVPADKYRLVRILQALGNHVAVTGDGVNDAPAIQAADVGITLASGTDATKGAADLVLLEDNLEVIVDGFEEGRRTFTNINRYLLYTMVSNFANVIIVAIASLVLNFLPLLPDQVLLLNVLADLPMLAIVTDTVSAEDVATPKRWDVRGLVELALFLGFVNALFAFGLLRLLGGQSPDTIRAAWFLFLGSTALFILFVVRTRGWFWSRPWPSTVLSLAVAAAFVVTVLLVNVPEARTLLHFGSINWQVQLGIEAYSAAFIVIADVLQQAFVRPRRPLPESGQPIPAR